MEEPLRGGFSDLLRQLDEWLSRPPYVTPDGREVPFVAGYPPLPGGPLGGLKKAGDITRQLAKIEKQLAMHGRGSVERSLRKLEGRVEEHRKALEIYKSTRRVYELGRTRDPCF